MTTKLMKRDYRYSKDRFLQICEYVSASPLLEDDDDNQEMQGNQMNGDISMNNQIDDNMNQQMGGINNTENGDMNGEQNIDNTQIDDEIGDHMDDQNGNGVSMDNQIGGDIDMTMDTMDDSDDEVIDVDDLTNAQEKVNDKVNHVGRNLEDVDDKISQLMLYIDKMENMINKNNEDIQAFKAEFERRNPTDVEKMNLRSANSYPFNVSPKDYWEEKEQEGKYSIGDDNNGENQKKYEITNNDIKDFNDASIAKSFYIDDDLRQSIEKIFDIK